MRFVHFFVSQFCLPWSLSRSTDPIGSRSNPQMVELKGKLVKIVINVDICLLFYSFFILCFPPLRRIRLSEYITVRSKFPQTSVNQLLGHPKTFPVIDWLHRRRDTRIGGFFSHHSHWSRGFCLGLLLRRESGIMKNWLVCLGVCHLFQGESRTWILYWRKI